MSEVLDEGGPFFHGTKAQLQPGDLLRVGVQLELPAGGRHESHLFHRPAGRGLDWRRSWPRWTGRHPHVYEVEPTGPFEDDPNVTDKKFPGNPPTRSFRSREPLRVVREVTDWTRLTPEALQTWKDRLAELRADERGEIIN